jgi:TonB-linked SusC/RagA family outer membrane protein
MRKFVTLLVCIAFFVFEANAQNRTISGRVTEKSGAPVLGATVVVEGSKTAATSTDAKGGFSITAKDGNSILVTAIGFKPMRIKVSGGQNNYHFNLEPTAVVMDEVIVTAGGIKAVRKEIGTANTVIKGDIITEGKATSIAGGLIGRVAGLQINSTGGGVNPNYRLVLRGQRSLTGNNQALVVLDNIIVPSSMLGNINPEDVESLVVLNGSGAAALYGSQASNGALIITTKKGKKGISEIKISQTSTLESVGFYPKFQTKFGAGGSGYGTDINGNPEFSYLENQSYGPAFDGSKRPLGPPLEDGSQDSAIYSYINGHEKFWVRGIINQTDLSFSDGDEKSTIYLSGQFATQSGTTPGDNYNRSIIRVNGTRRLGNTINLTYNSSYTQNRYDITTQTATMYNNMLNMPSNVDITKYSDWRNNKFANPNGFYNPWYQNPYFTKDNYRSKQRNDYLTANVELKFTPIKNLDFVARQGIMTRNFSNKNTVGAFAYTDYAKHTDASSKTDIPASESDGSNYTTELISDLFAQYEKKVSNFNFKLIAGGQWQQDEAKYVGVSANGLVIPGIFNVSNGVGTPGASESNYKARKIGTYGDMRIGFKNYLYVHGSIRNDWVSILAPENRSFFYPAVDLSFIPTEAIDFLRNSSTISYLKLRAGWSKVGQVNLGNSGDFGAYYLEPTIYPANGFPFGSLPGYTIGNTLVSSGLKPEITKGYEAGFDISIKKDFVTANATWFHTRTSNQTVTTGVSGTTGFTGLRTNTGETQSQGLEFTAHVTPIKTRDWTVTVGGMYTYLDNTVLSISTDLPKLSLAAYGSGVGSYAVPGMVFPVIMGFDYVRDPQGHVIVDAVSGLPTQSPTISVLGNATAKNKLSFDGSIRFKNFQFSFLFEYRGGYQIFNSMGSAMDWSGTSYRTAIFDRQRFVFPNSVIADPNNPGKYIKNTNVTVQNGNGNNGFWSDGINRSVTSNYVTSADFWKLRELVLSYEVPTSLISKTKFIKGLKLSVQGRNLLMWMAKDNYYTDPEYSDAGNDSNGIGLSGLQTPPSRYYGATIAFKF